ncbi:hypothetical protein RSE70_004013 [Yersinia enterocolitica]|nr:hypothetical protein [Yersinia enterocolitica]
MKLIIAISFIAISFASTAAAQEQKDNTKFIQDLMLRSKLAGMCGAIKQMGNFQESTKMPGGDEFIARFLATEQARLNVSPQQFLDVCEKATSTYNDYAPIQP